MKALLIKDFKLLKHNRSLFIIYMIIMATILIFTEGASFGVEYITIISALFSISTVNYDENDNGFAFLFAMPISRNDYTVEKYVFGLTIGAMSWLTAVSAAFFTKLMRHEYVTGDEIAAVLLILPIFAIFLAVILPFRLKFGGEKGSAVIAAVFGAMFFLSYAAVKSAELFNIDAAKALDSLSGADMAAVIAVLTLIAAVMLIISVKISIMIMEKKEF